MKNERGARPTLRDVARSVGVDVSTVSRVLNGHATVGRIAPETAQRVRLIAERLGYRGNTVARALRTGRTLIIGMVIPDIANLYQARIARGAEDALTVEGYSLLISSTDNNLERSRRQILAMVSAQTEGILYGVARLDDDVLDEIVAAETPVVLFNRQTEDGRASAVLPDNHAGIRLAVRHLVELGHRSIVHVAGPADISSGVARRAAFDEALREYGLTGQSEPAGRHTEDEGLRVTGLLLDRVPDATAVIAANDRLALGAIDALRSSGLDCPGNVSVVGFNDMLYADRVSPPLTTVRVPQYDLGHRAASLLLETIKDPDRQPVTEFIAPDLIVRGSTAAPRPPRTARRGPDRPAVRALRPRPRLPG